MLKKIDNKIEIHVKDNGAGIPQKVVDKIFQPFFTTKPTGQGTGLGLSLSYDIIKAHGGEIKVQTTESEARPAARAGTDADDPRLNDSVGQAVGRAYLPICFWTGARKNLSLLFFLIKKVTKKSSRFPCLPAGRDAAQTSVEHFLSRNRRLGTELNRTLSAEQRARRREPILLSPRCRPGD